MSSVGKVGLKSVKAQLKAFKATVLAFYHSFSRNMFCGLMIVVLWVILQTHIS